MSRSIAVISGKGGVGKSFFCVNVAAALAMRRCPTLIVDADSGMRNADIILRKSNSFIYDLADLERGGCTFADALVDVAGRGRLALIPGAKDPDYVPSPEFLKKLAEEASKKYKFILFDSPAGIGATVRNAALAADDIVIITNPQKEAAIPAAAAAETVRRSCPDKPAYVVVNRVEPDGLDKRDMSPDQIMDSCRARLLGVIYRTDEVEKARRGNTLLVSRKSLEAVQIKNIAARLCGERAPLAL